MSHLAEMRPLWTTRGPILDYRGGTQPQRPDKGLTKDQSSDFSILPIRQTQQEARSLGSRNEHGFPEMQNRGHPPSCPPAVVNRALVS